MEKEKNKKVDDAKVPFFWMRDSSGHRSVSVTLLIVSFIVTTVAFVLSIFEKIGPLSIRSFDVAACSSYFIPVLTLYFSRKWTDAKTGLQAMRESASIANKPIVDAEPSAPSFPPSDT